MKRKFACVGFWWLSYLIFQLLGVLIGTFISGSYVDFGSVIILLVAIIVFTGLAVMLYIPYDPFRENYHFVLETPLNYHKCFCCLTLPFNLLITVLVICLCFTVANLMSSIFVLIWGILYIILICICCVGLLKWRRYGLRALIAFLAFRFVCSLVGVVICSIYLPSYTVDSLSSMLSTVVDYAIVGLYYYKRRELFASRIFEKVSLSIATEASEETFCENCGYKIENGLHFCTSCGKSVAKK